MCHIGFVSDNGQPFVIPTGYARDGETLYFHGSVGSRMLRALETGAGQGLIAGPLMSTTPYLMSNMKLTIFSCVAVHAQTSV